MPETPSTWTVLTMLEWATEFFEEKAVKSPRLSIEWLLAHVLGVKRLDLYLSYDRPLSSQELSALNPLVKRRAKHEPLQYITGETDFHRVVIKVNPYVLIPRQETEQLVEFILENHPANQALKVVDIGTGSGCIPISIKKERPEWTVSAIDISEGALQVAKENAESNQTEIHFVKDDILSPKAFSADKKFDLIISNPPYILPDEKSTLDREVADYEPELALFCSSTEKMYGAIEGFGAKYLADGGTLYLELHEQHSEEVHRLFEESNWRVNIIKDYEDKPRFLVAKKN